MWRIESYLRLYVFGGGLLRHGQFLDRVKQDARPDIVVVAVREIDKHVVVIEILAEHDAHPYLGAAVVACFVPAAGFAIFPARGKVAIIAIGEAAGPPEPRQPRLRYQFSLRDGGEEFTDIGCGMACA
jgi:hypothetical protein